MLTVVAVLVLWSLASVVLGVLLGGVIALRGRDRALAADCDTSLDLPVPALPAAVS